LELISLDLKNFKVIKSAEIKFPKVVTAIIGPNEAGKSTIIKGILFALFGQSAFVSYDNVVHFKSNKAKVKLDFSLKNKKYRISRVLHKSKSGSTSQKNTMFYEILEGGKTRVLAKGISNVDNLIEKTIGFTINEMTSSNIIAQKKLNKITKMTPTEWKELFNEFLNLKGFGKAIVELKEEKREKKHNLENDQIRFIQLEKQKDNYCNQYKKLIQLSKEYLRDALELRELKEHIEINAEYLNVIKEFIDKKYLKEKLEDEKKSKDDLLNEKQDQLAKIKKLEEENENLKKELEKFENLDDDDKRIFTIKELFEKYRTVLDKIKQLEERIEYLEGLEEKLNVKTLRFEQYKNIPEQLENFREIQRLYSNLENNHQNRDQLREELEKIIEAEQDNLNLKLELEKINRILSYKDKYLHAEDIFKEFKAKIDQIKFERTHKNELTYNIKSIRRKCPKETPDQLKYLKLYKKDKNKVI